MRRYIVSIVFIVLAGLSVYAFVFYWKNLRGAGVPLGMPSQDIRDLFTQGGNSNATSSNTTGMPLKLPLGFGISIFADNVAGARVMKFDPSGSLWVSRTSEGKITRLLIKDGKVTGQADVLGNLSKPHGIAFDPADSSILYVAEENAVFRVRLSDKGAFEKIFDLPANGGHSTRTIGFGADGRLYVAIGSSCNVCNERDPRRAAIYSMNKDGSDTKVFARGLRNSVFFTWHPATNKMWATDMGRDLIGDDIPPDEVNIVEEGRFYGWPVCYGKNVHDTNFDLSRENPCKEPAAWPSHIDLQAHSAPLGLAFLTGPAWPEQYQDDLVIAYHGSWNRTQPTGYKVIRYRLSKEGVVEGMEDFITGWLIGGEALGRPADIIVGPDQALYISDDKAGVIYRVNTIK